MKEPERKIIEGTLCIVHIGGKYLLRLETEGINKGCYIFPGGGYERINFSESRESGVECCTRETIEETGITPVRPILRARIFFDNHKRVFPGKTEIASFDYDALYYFSKDYTGRLNPIGPDRRKQALFTPEEMTQLPMHEGDREIFKAHEKIPPGRIFEGVILHNKSKLEYAIFQDI